MKKIKLMIEMDEETYNTTRSKIGYWLSNLLNRRTAFPYRLYSEFYEDKRIEECDDAVSREAVMELLNKRYCHKEPYERKEGNTVYKGYDTYYMINFDKLKALPPVLPKREENTVSEEVYTEEYLQRKKLECELYLLKRKISELI